MEIRTLWEKVGDLSREKERGGDRGGGASPLKSKKCFGCEVRKGKQCGYWRPLGQFTEAVLEFFRSTGEGAIKEGVFLEKGQTSILIFLFLSFSFLALFLSSPLSGLSFPSFCLLLFCWYPGGTIELASR